MKEGSLSTAAAALADAAVSDRTGRICVREVCTRVAKTSILLWNWSSCIATLADWFLAAGDQLQGLDGKKHREVSAIVRTNHGLRRH